MKSIIDSGDLQYARAIQKFLVAMVDRNAPFDTRAIGDAALHLHMTGELAHLVDAPAGRLHGDFELGAIAGAQQQLLRRRPLRERL